jgi:hypothetical protein
VQHYNSSKKEPFLNDLEFLENDILQCKAIKVAEILNITLESPWIAHETANTNDVMATMEEWANLLFTNVTETAESIMASQFGILYMKTLTSGGSSSNQGKGDKWEDILLSFLAGTFTNGEEELVRMPSEIAKYPPEAMFRRRWQLGVTKQGLFGLVHSANSERRHRCRPLRRQRTCYSPSCRR